MMRTARFATFTAIAAGLVLGGAGCSSILGIDDFTTGTTDPDGMTDGADGTASSARIEGTITLYSGATLLPSHPASASVTWSAIASGAVQASTTTDASGHYLLDLTAVTAARTGQIATSFSSNLTEYDVPGTVAMPIQAHLNAYDQPAFDELVTRAGMTRISGSGTLVAIVESAARTPVAGAVVTSDPVIGTVVYGDASGFPRSDLVATTSSGTAWFFNATPGTSYTLSASAGGAQYADTYGHVLFTDDLRYAAVIPP